MRITRRPMEPEMSGAEMHTKHPERHLELHIASFVREHVIAEGAERISRLRAARRITETSESATKAQES